MRRRGRMAWVTAALAPATAAVTLVAVAPADAQPPVAAPRRDVGPTSLVDPWVGTGGSAPWFSGNTTPAAARPFGMVQLGPDTTTDAVAGAPSGNASGYAVTDTLVRGFSATHLSGAGCPAFGDAPWLPVTGPVPSDPGAATVGFSHADERAFPGRYRVRLANGVGVRLTAGLRSGLAGLQFPRGEPGRIVVKAGGGLAGAERARLRVLSSSEVAVSATSGGFCGSPGRYRVHLLLQFDRPASSWGTWGGRVSADGRTVVGPRSGAWVAFPTVRDPTVRMRIGVSFVDRAGARRNLSAEPHGWSLARQRAAAERAWDTELARIHATGGSATDRSLLTTALYHALLHPTLVSDADGRYPGFDGRVHRTPPGRRQYTAVPGWDAYRTHMPLLALLRPDVASDTVASLLRMAGQGGWLPRWPLVASYTGVMNGDSAGPLIAAAHAFGARDFRLGRAVAQLVRNAEATGGAPGQGWFQPRPGGADYLRLGYVPNTSPEPGWSQPHGASTTLEYAVDDFAAGRLARAAGRPVVADRLLIRSRSWRSLLDVDRRLLLPLDAAGGFPGAGYDPAACCDGFQEGNAIQYTWAVPHDMGGLLAALGARADVLARLADFHAELNAGAGSAHAWMGNQPSLASPWAYLWLREPMRAQDVVARARDQLWTPTPDGIPGNDDLGSLSAWYVWTSLGLYPLTPGTSVVGVTRPAFRRVEVVPSRGAAWRIVRRGSGSHVSGLAVDGDVRTASWLRLGPGQRPRRLVVSTSDATRLTWGTRAADVPPSPG